MPKTSAWRGYATGLAMTLSSPLTLAFWFVAVPATVGQITKEPRRDLPMICAGVFIGTVGWVVAFSGLLHAAGRFRRGWWLTAADALGGIMLIGFAAAAAIVLWKTLPRPG